jgi:hypothetical protein
VRRLARLSPGTGQLTEWNFNGDFERDLMFEAGRAFFLQISPTPNVVALDPSVSGIGSVLTTSSSASVASVSSIVPEVTYHHIFRAGLAFAHVESVSASTSGAFTTWPIGTPQFATTNADGAVFFTTATGTGRPAIGRLTP